MLSCTLSHPPLHTDCETAAQLQCTLTSLDWETQIYAGPLQANTANPASFRQPSHHRKCTSGCLLHRAHMWHCSTDCTELRCFTTMYRESIVVDANMQSWSKPFSMDGDFLDAASNRGHQHPVATFPPHHAIKFGPETCDSVTQDDPRYSVRSAQLEPVTPSCPVIPILSHKRGKVLLWKMSAPLLRSPGLNS